MIADVAPGAESSPFTFLRTDGHGCNGRQGQFTLVPTLPNVAAVGQQFSYDSHGGMGFQPNAPTVNYLSRLKQRGRRHLCLDGHAIRTVAVAAAGQPAFPRASNASREASMRARLASAQVQTPQKASLRV